LFAYREVPVETLGCSPFELLFGRSVTGPLALVNHVNLLKEYHRRDMDKFTTTDSTHNVLVVTSAPTEDNNKVGEEEERGTEPSQCDCRLSFERETELRLLCEEFLSIFSY
jgi:hypothetical protein